MGQLICEMHYCWKNYRAARRDADRRRRERNRDPFTYCRLPTSVRRKIIWEEIEVVAVNATKGKGLVARKDLPAGLCIPYGGVFCPRWEQKAAEKHCNDNGEHLTSHGAAARCKDAAGKTVWGMMDAHPRHMRERKVPEGAWPGGFCNQADRREDQNADLIQHDGKCTAPAYDWMDARCCNLFVKLNRSVSAGEEILVDYRYSRSKQTRLGVGFDAKRPRVVSDYSFRKRKPIGKYGETQLIV